MYSFNKQITKHVHKQEYEKDHGYTNRQENYLGDISGLHELVYVGWLWIYTEDRKLDTKGYTPYLSNRSLASL